jgi:phenylpyruvate tautomerase PptA (4-oxalocrotonate tautomerase family)
MPFIHIKSLPFEEDLEMSSILTAVSRDFSEQMGMKIEHVTVTWEYLEAWHYAAGGRTVANQPSDSHPILVDLLVPDFNPPETIEKMLKCVAASIANRVRIPENNIFINVRPSQSGQVFDAGEIVRW